VTALRTKAGNEIVDKKKNILNAERI